MIHVTHDLGEVLRLATDIVVLRQGHLIDAGPVAEVLNRAPSAADGGVWPAGSLLTARVGGHDSRWGLLSLDLHGQTLQLPHPPLPPGTALRLRVAARDVALALQRPQGLSIRNALAGTLLELTGAPGAAQVDALVAVGPARLTARITAAAADELRLAPGLPVFALLKSVAIDGHPMPHDL